MAEVKVSYDRQGNTLTVWFGNPQEEYICEETGDEVVLMKNKAGVVIGFEKLNYSLQELSDLRFSFEALDSLSPPSKGDSGGSSLITVHC